MTLKKRVLPAAVAACPIDQACVAFNTTVQRAGELPPALIYVGNDMLSVVDRARIGVTGLSGGGWQTMMLGSLDSRIGPSVPVAGFSSLTTAIEHPTYAGDAEQNGTDMRAVADYAQLMALRAPREPLD